MKGHYSPEEANAILEAALRGQPLPGDVSREQLLQTAAEVGITPEALDAAEAEWRAGSDPDSAPDLDALYAEYMQQANLRSVVFRAVFSVLILLVLLVSASLIAPLWLSGVSSLVILLSVILLVVTVLHRRGSDGRHGFRRRPRLRSRRGSLSRHRRR